MVQLLASRASEASGHDQQDGFRPCKGDKIAFFTYAFEELYSKEASGNPDQDESPGKELSTVVDGQDLQFSEQRLHFTLEAKKLMFVPRNTSGGFSHNPVEFPHRILFVEGNRHHTII
jgi:hypothetical protein